MSSPWWTERAGQQLAQTTEIEPSGQDERDSRILLPLSHHATSQRRLLEFAFLLKDEDAVEPIHLLTVVSPTIGNTEQQVALVERDLERAAEIGGTAEIPVAAETRVNHNIASGISRGSVETRADMIMMGWDANQAFGRRIFGDIIDQVLARTAVPILVSRLGHPINTTEQLFVVIPYGIDHHEGFYEGIHIVKRLALKLGTSVTAIVVGEMAQQYERLFNMVEIDVDATFMEADWNELLSLLEQQARSDDLIIPLSPREGEVGWHSELATLPRQLVELPPRSFVMVYLRHGEPEYAAQFLRFK